MTRHSLPVDRYRQNETIVLFESENEKKFPDFYSAGGKSGSWEGVAKSIKALNHKKHKSFEPQRHEGTKEAFFVCPRSSGKPQKTLCLRAYVVPFFSVPFATPSWGGIRRERDGFWRQAVAASLRYTHSRGQCGKFAPPPCRLQPPGRRSPGWPMPAGQ